jgi:hypothetical protein
MPKFPGGSAGLSGDREVWYVGTQPGKKTTVAGADSQLAQIVSVELLMSAIAGPGRNRCLILATTCSDMGESSPSLFDACQFCDAAVVCVA